MFDHAYGNYMVSMKLVCAYCLWADCIQLGTLELELLMYVFNESFQKQDKCKWAEYSWWWVLGNQFIEQGRNWNQIMKLCI